MGLWPCSPPHTHSHCLGPRQGEGGRGAKGGGEEEWLPGRVEMVYWMHIVILFSCQGDLSGAEEIRSSYFGFFFFITAWRRNAGLRMHISRPWWAEGSGVWEYTLVCVSTHTRFYTAPPCEMQLICLRLAGYYSGAACFSDLFP